LKTIFPIVAKDFLKLIVGLLVSVSIVVAIHVGQDLKAEDDATPESTEVVTSPSGDAGAKIEGAED
jgi:hypothetical protein